MKFRAKLSDIMCIQQFIRVINTISRLTKTIVLRLTPTKLNFVLNSLSTSNGVSIWCELDEGNYFNEYNMEGVSKEDNNIFLELVSENISRALKAAQNAKSVKIKLTKKHAPCLTVEIELPSLTQRSRIVVHDVPVTVIPRRMWKDYDEPTMADFNVSLYMPSMKTVKSVAERMKNLSNFVLLNLKSNGEMTFKVETDEVEVSTHFKDLPKPAFDKENLQNDDEGEVKLDLKKLSHFLSGQQICMNRVICNIVNRKMVQFFIVQNDVSLQYFLSGISFSN